MRKVSKIQIAVVIEPMCIKEKFIPKYTCHFYLIKFKLTSKLQSLKTQIHIQSNSQAQSQNNEC